MHNEKCSGCPACLVCMTLKLLDWQISECKTCHRLWFWHITPDLQRIEVEIGMAGTNEPWCEEQIKEKRDPDWRKSDRCPCHMRRLG